MAVGLALGAWLFGLGCQAVGPAAAPSPASFPLAGSSWLAHEIEGQGVADGVTTTLTFESAARAVGSTGCNRYVAPLAVTGAALRVGDAAMTRRACPPAVMEQERRFTEALGAVRSYRQDGGTLWLLDESGRAVLRLSRSPSGAAPPAAAPAGPVAAGAAPVLAAYAFECAGGPPLTVRLIDADALEVELPAGARRLPHVPSASGAKYQDGDILVWIKGAEALLEAGGQTYRCLENRARSLLEDARARGVEFRGVGQEPGWVLEVLAERLVFVGALGQERVITPRPPMTVDPSTRETRYTAATEAHRLRVRIAPAECRDSMSGERYEATVEVELDGRRYRGCGAALR